MPLAARRRAILRGTPGEFGSMVEDDTDGGITAPGAAPTHSRTAWSSALHDAVSCGRFACRSALKRVRRVIMPEYYLQSANFIPLTVSPRPHTGRRATTPRLSPRSFISREFWHFRRRVASMPQFDASRCRQDYRRIQARRRSADISPTTLPRHGDIKHITPLNSSSTLVLTSTFYQKEGEYR